MSSLSLIRPRFTKYKPRRLRIPRPEAVDTTRSLCVAWMYFNGYARRTGKAGECGIGHSWRRVSLRWIRGRVTTSCWPGRDRTGLPDPELGLSAKRQNIHIRTRLNECFDVYTQIVATRGRCIGMKPDSCPRIVITGDSAGGNLACGHDIDGHSVQPKQQSLARHPALSSRTGPIAISRHWTSILAAG